MRVDLTALSKPDYAGSVQNLFFLNNPPATMLCETTRGGSVFDVGTIFSIENGDICRALVRHTIYTMLADSEQWRELYKLYIEGGEFDLNFTDFLRGDLVETFKSEGAKTHHLGMIDESSGALIQGYRPTSLSKYLLVKRFDIVKPVQVRYKTVMLWDYSGHKGITDNVVPLENIVRLGITPSSSVLKKYMNLSTEQRKTYLKEFGLEKGIVPWEKFTTATVDFTTKYEPEDRNLSLQEAFYISGLDGKGFINLSKMALLGALMVKKFFEGMGLFLWDIKWEFANGSDGLTYVDTIDTDSVRVTTDVEFDGAMYHVHFNKQSMRDYYRIRHKAWFDGVNAAKVAAKKTGASFVEILKEGQRDGTYPFTPEVDQVFLDIQKEKFAAIIRYIQTGEDIRTAMKSISRSELSYYKDKGGFSEFAAMNKV